MRRGMTYTSAVIPSRMVNPDLIRRFSRNLAELDARSTELETRWKRPQMRSAAAPETALHATADQYLSQLTVAIRYGFAAAKKSVAAKLATAKTRAEVETLMAGVPQTLQAELSYVLSGTLARIVRAGGVTGMEMIQSMRTAEARSAANFGIKFNVEDDAAVQWAMEHATELAANLSKTSREAIKEAIASVLEGDSFSDAYADILDAVGDEARAMMIARTEIMTAVHEGQREAWSQAVDEGLLTGRERRVWIATEGACPACEELDGETAPMDGTYPDGIDGPPLHPNCRCTEGLQ